MALFKVCFEDNVGDRDGEVRVIEAGGDRFADLMHAVRKLRRSPEGRSLIGLIAGESELVQPAQPSPAVPVRQVPVPSRPASVPNRQNDANRPPDNGSGVRRWRRAVAVN